MNYIFVILVALAVIFLFIITGGFPWLFVGLLQGGIALPIFTVQELGIVTVPEGVTLPALAAIASMGAVMLWLRFPARRRRLLSPLSVMIFLFSFLVIAGIFYSWHNLAIDKALKYIAANLVSFFVVLFLSSQQRKKLYTLLVAVAIIVAIGVIFNFISSGQGAVRGRYGTFGIDTISATRLIGLGMIFVLYLQQYKRHRWGYILVLGVGMLLAASRAPLLALLVAILTQPWLNTNSRFLRLQMPRRILWLGAGFVVALLMLLIVVTLSRPVRLAENWGPLRLVRETTLSDKNIRVRFNLWTNFYQDVQQSPLIGMGTAGYGGSSPVRDPTSQAYPHNIFIEVLTEWGLFGFLLFILIIWRSVFILKRLGRQVHKVSLYEIHDELRAVTTLFVFALVNACFSGEIYHNRVLWLALGVVEALRYEMARHYVPAPQPQFPDSGFLSNIGAQ